VRGSRAGLTLIELVVALAIATVVFATVFLLYRVTAGAALRQKDRTAAFAPAAAFDELRRDAAGLVPGNLDDRCAVKLEFADLDGGRRASRAMFCTWRVAPGERDAFWSTAQAVEWRLEGAGTPAAALCRISAPLTGPKAATPETNVLMTGIGSFRLQFLYRDTWHERWPMNDDTNALPSALRVEIVPATATTRATNWTTDFLIPVGLTFTSSFQRAAAR